MEPKRSTTSSPTGAVTGGSAMPPTKNKAMPKVLLIVAGVLVIAGAAWAVVSMYGQNQSAQVEALQEDEPTVSITSSGFSPATIKVKANQEITWTNEDVSEHQLKADESELPGFDSIESLTTGDSYTYIFETPGIFHYYDPNDTTFFKGTVVVE